MHGPFPRCYVFIHAIVLFGLLSWVPLAASAPAAGGACVPASVADKLGIGQRPTAPSLASLGISDTHIDDVSNWMVCTLEEPVASPDTLTITTQRLPTTLPILAFVSGKAFMLRDGVDDSCHRDAASSGDFLCNLASVDDTVTVVSPQYIWLYMRDVDADAVRIAIFGPDSVRVHQPRLLVASKSPTPTQSSSYSISTTTGPSSSKSTSLSRTVSHSPTSSLSVSPSSGASMTASPSQSETRSPSGSISATVTPSPSVSAAGPALSTGAILGIAVGGGCGVILIAVLLGIALWRHRQHSSKQSASSSQRRSVSAGSVTSGSVPKARTWHLTDSGVTMPTRQPVYPPLPKPASAGNSGDDDPASVSSDEEDEVDVTRKTVTTSRRSAEQLRQPSDDSASNSDDSSIVEAVPTSRTANDVNPSSGNANQSSPELKQERNTPSPTKVPSRSPAISPPVAPTVTTVSGSDNDNDEDDTQLIHSIAASLRSTTPKQRRQSAATTRSSRSKSRQSRSGNGKKKSGRRSVSRAASVVSVGEEGSSNAELLEELRRARLLAETQDELWRQERKHMLKLMRKLAKRSNTVITEELKLQSILGGALAVNTAALSDSELESIQAPVAMSSNSIGIAMPSPTRALSSPKPPLHPQSPTRSAIVSGRGTPRSSGGDSRKGMVSFVSGGSESTGEVLGTLQFTQETPQLRLVQHSNGSVKLWSAPKQQFLQPSSAPSPAPSLTTGRLTPMIPLPPEYIPHTEELNQSHVISLGKARLPSPTRTVGVMSSDLSAYHPIAFNPSSAASQPSSVSSVRGMQGGYRNVAATARLSASGGNRRLNKKKLVDRRRRSTVTVGVRPPRSPSRGSETRPQPSTSTSAGGGDGHWVYVPPSAPVSMRAPSPAQAPIPLSPAAVPAVVQLSNGQWAIPLSALGLGGGGGGGGEAFRTAPQQGTVQQRLIPARTMTPQGGVRVGTPLF